MIVISFKTNVCFDLHLYRCIRIATIRHLLKIIVNYLDEKQKILRHYRRLETPILFIIWKLSSCKSNDWDLCINMIDDLNNLYNPTSTKGLKLSWHKDRSFLRLKVLDYFYLNNFRGRISARSKRVSRVRRVTVTAAALAASVPAAVVGGPAVVVALLVGRRLLLKVLRFSNRLSAKELQHVGNEAESQVWDGERLGHTSHCWFRFPLQIQLAIPLSLLLIILLGTHDQTLLFSYANQILSFRSTFSSFTLTQSAHTTDAAACGWLIGGLVWQSETPLLKNTFFRFSVFVSAR